MILDRIHIVSFYMLKKSLRKMRNDSRKRRYSIENTQI